VYPFFLGTLDFRALSLTCALTHSRARSFSLSLSLSLARSLASFLFPIRRFRVQAALAEQLRATAAVVATKADLAALAGMEATCRKLMAFETHVQVLGEVGVGRGVEGSQR
jgi:hypothetical protein